MTRIGILFYDGFDLIDAGGPYEVFLTASRLAVRDGAAATFEAVLISPDGSDVTAFGGLTLTNMTAPDKAGSLDVVVIPGTTDVTTTLADEAIGSAVAQLVGAAPLTTAVCTGAFLLAQQGVLDGVPATTHWEDIEDLRAAGVAEVVSGVRWVDAGDVVTSGGLTSGMHMALHMVARLEGQEMAERTAKQLDMDWSTNPER